MEPTWTHISSDPNLPRSTDAEGPIGRIIAQDGPLSLVVSGRGTEFARPSGRLAYLTGRGETPVPGVGDYIRLDASATHIKDVLPRRSRFERKEAGARSEPQLICANVDRALIVTTAPPAAVRDQADVTSLHDFNVRRIERYIATLDPRVRPTVIVNKCDLVVNPELVRQAIRSELPGIDVSLISALSGIGISELMESLAPGTTSVLVGSSGSGKSTLIRALTGAEVRTGSIRESDGRGRHTTTGRRMFALANGALVVDTPGMREIQLWVDESSGDQLASAFPEIEALAAHCRFSDCRHENEPGCAVREAVRSGEVTSDRYLSYLELHSEQDVAAMRREKRERLNQRRSARKSRTKRRSRGS